MAQKGSFADDDDDDDDDKFLFGSFIRTEIERIGHVMGECFLSLSRSLPVFFAILNAYPVTSVASIRNQWSVSHLYLAKILISSSEVK
jgi:hypothetical protein